MSDLRLIAGKTARARLAETGLTPDAVRLVLGASGGPKWLVLRGLDQAVFGEWLPGAAGEIPLIGSSIGAWRMTAAAHPDPADAFNRFEDGYFAYRYSPGDKADKITRDSYDMLNRLFSARDRAAIVGNRTRPVHIVTVRAKGWLASEVAVQEGAGLFAAMTANALDRRAVGRFFERAVFHSGPAVAYGDQWRDFGRIDIPLTAANLNDALMASGSIPFVIDPIRDIDGAPPGVYRDGGVIDYHFDIPWRVDGGIVLYPHFYPHAVPGWFDKMLKKRRAAPSVFDEMLVLAPSDAFVARLPYGRIPDRRNFTAMDDADRRAYWRRVADESRRLGDAFRALAARPDSVMDSLEPAETLMCA